MLRRFYGAMVAMGYLEPSANPLAVFPTIKAVPRKLPLALSQDQVSRLLAEPKTTTILGVRDRALLALLYGTGVRAAESTSECDCGGNEAASAFPSHPIACATPLQLTWSAPAPWISDQEDSCGKLT